MPTTMRYHAEKLVFALIRETTKGQLFGKGDLGEVLLRHADAVDGAGEVNGKDFRKRCHPRRLGYSALRGVADIAEINVFRWRFGVHLDGPFELLDAFCCTLLEGI